MWTSEDDRFGTLDSGLRVPIPGEPYCVSQGSTHVDGVTGGKTLRTQTRPRRDPGSPTPTRHRGTLFPGRTVLKGHPRPVRDLARHGACDVNARRRDKDSTNPRVFTSAHRRTGYPTISIGPSLTAGGSRGPNKGLCLEPVDTRPEVHRPTCKLRTLGTPPFTPHVDGVGTTPLDRQGSSVETCPRRPVKPGRIVDRSETVWVNG